MNASQLKSGLERLYSAVLRGISFDSSEPISLDLDKWAERLVIYGRLLSEWQESFHLLGELNDLVDLHLLDSASGAFLLLHLGNSGGRIVDVGSGLGLPGIPLALCLHDCGYKFYLVEAGRRRANILRSLVRELDLQSFTTVCEHPVEEWGRHQNLQNLGGEHCIVTCRAFRPLNKKSWKQLQAPLLGAKSGGVLLYKGNPVHAYKEVQELHVRWLSSVFELPNCGHQRCLFYSAVP